MITSLNGSGIVMIGFHVSAAQRAVRDSSIKHHSPNITANFSMGP